MEDDASMDLIFASGAQFVHLVGMCVCHLQAWGNIGERTCHQPSGRLLLLEGEDALGSGDRVREDVVVDRSGSSFGGILGLFGLFHDEQLAYDDRGRQRMTSAVSCGFGEIRPLPHLSN